MFIAHFRLIILSEFIVYNTIIIHLMCSYCNYSIKKACLKIAICMKIGRIKVTVISATEEGACHAVRQSKVFH